MCIAGHVTFFFLFFLSPDEQQVLGFVAGFTGCSFSKGVLSKTAGLSPTNKRDQKTNRNSEIFFFLGGGGWGVVVKFSVYFQIRNLLRH